MIFYNLLIITRECYSPSFIVIFKVKNCTDKVVKFIILIIGSLNGCTSWNDDFLDLKAMDENLKGYFCLVIAKNHVVYQIFKNLGTFMNEKLNFQFKCPSEKSTDFTFLQQLKLIIEGKESTSCP